MLVDLGGEAPDAGEHVGDLEAYLERYRNEELRSGGRIDYEVKANWKGIAQNYSECLHCPGVHPELNALSHYLSGDELRGEGAWCGGSMTLTAEGASTMGSGGGHASNRPPIEGIEGDGVNTIFYVVLFPNALVSMHPDYVMLHTIYPRAHDRTDVICEWFFEPRTIEAPDFDPSDAIEFWDLTNRQDWHVCELAQKGAGSRGYTAGRYSLQEADVHEFDSMIAERYLEALGSRRGAGLNATAASAGEASPPEEVAVEPVARDRILAAASDLIASDGIDEVRIARVATRARASTALVHHYFSTRGSCSPTRSCGPSISPRRSASTAMSSRPRDRRRGACDGDPPIPSRSPAPPSASGSCGVELWLGRPGSRATSRRGEPLPPLPRLDRRDHLPGVPSPASSSATGPSGWPTTPWRCSTDGPPCPDRGSRARPRPGAARDRGHPRRRARGRGGTLH